MLGVRQNRKRVMDSTATPLGKRSRESEAGLTAEDAEAVIAPGPEEKLEDPVISPSTSGNNEQAKNIEELLKSSEHCTYGG